MAKEQIRVKVKKDGTIEVMAQNIVGKSCVEATADLEVFLGSQVGQKEFTADYFKKEDPGNKAWINRQ